MYFEGTKPLKLTSAPLQTRRPPTFTPSARLRKTPALLLTSKQLHDEASATFARTVPVEIQEQSETICDLLRIPSILRLRGMEKVARFDQRILAHRHITIVADMTDDRRSTSIEHAATLRTILQAIAGFDDRPRHFLEGFDYMLPHVQSRTAHVVKIVASVVPEQAPLNIITSSIPAVTAHGARVVEEHSYAEIEDRLISLRKRARLEA